MAFIKLLSVSIVFFAFSIFAFDNQTQHSKGDLDFLQWLHASEDVFTNFGISVTLIAENIPIKADKSTLSIRSSYFKKALSGKYLKNNEIDFKDEIPFWALVKIVRLIYNQEIDNNGVLTFLEAQNFLNHIDYFDLNQYLEKIYPLVMWTGQGNNTDSGVPYDRTKYIREERYWSNQRGWRDCKGKVWSEVARSPDGAIMYLNSREASAYCESQKGRLPDYEDFTELALSMGKGYIWSAYYPQIIPDLGLNFWTNTSMKARPSGMGKAQPEYVFEGSTGNFIAGWSAQHEHPDVFAVICILNR